MTFDCSRFSFDPSKDYLGVVKQQGRVDLDSDWNEFQAELARRVQAGTMDTFGRAVVPATTPYGFKIAAYADGSGQHVTIGAGRMYVDGLLIENHGTGTPTSWDPSLAELSWAPPGGAEVVTDYTKQPYYPGAVLPAGNNGPFLAYVDVWRRPVSYLDDPGLLEVAVGVDSTGRLQTVWQVRLLDVSAVSATIAGGVSCSTPDAAIQPWLDLIQPSAALLTTNVVPSTSTGLCSLAPAAGYTGLENQLYRVEIHQGGAANASGTVASPGATFKWSRDNASVITAVSAIGPATNSLTQPSSILTVQSTGRDSVLGFAPGNWIEIIDDYTDLNGQSGELHLIDTKGVDVTARTITLVTPVSAGFATRLNDPTVNYHTRITRWDQSGQVLRGDNAALWVDLTLPGSSGQIPVPPSGVPLVLEGGITVAFDLASANGSFVARDDWTFTARTATGEVELLSKAPPSGIHHHYARLSVVTFPSTASDCRSPWPPLAQPCCGCTICVGPGDLTANLPLQAVLDNYKNQPGPTVICLKQGSYVLTAPLRLTAAHSNITLKACQPGTVLLQAQPGQESQFSDGIVVLDNTANSGLIGLGFVVPLVPFAATQFAGLALTSLDPDVQSLLTSLSVSIAVRPFNCAGLVIEKCRFDLTPMRNANASATPFGVGVLAGGQCSGWRLEDNTFSGAGDFAAGFLITAAVAFNPPPPPRRPQPRPGLLNTGSGFSRFNNIFQQGTSSIGLAAQGGKVVPGVLSGSTFRSNLFSNLTIAVLSLAGTTAVTTGINTVQFVANTVTNCTGGVWLLSPLQAAALANVPLNLTIVVGLSVALGYPVPQGDATAPVAIAAAPASVRICTATTTITDSAGNIWTPDAATAGVTHSGGALNQVQHAISGCAQADEPLYQHERWGTSFSYTFTGLSMGYYQVTLKFAELFHNTAGQRPFDVSINGQQVLTNFDIFSDISAANSGNGEYYADDKVYANIVPASGNIVIQFTGTGIPPQDTAAKIGAVAIDAHWSTALANPSSLQGATGTTRITELQNFFAQILALGKQGFASLAPLARQTRVTDNQMQGLTSPAVLVFGDDSVQNGLSSTLFMTGNRFGSQAILPATTDQVPGQTETGPVPAVFYWLSVSTVADVAQCLVSGNMMILEATPVTTTSFFRFAYLMDNSVLPQPLVTVMSNMFGGPMYVTPDRPSPYSALPAPTGQWVYLNTT